MVRAKKTKQNKKELDGLVLNFGHLPGFLPSPNTSWCCTAKQTKTQQRNKNKTQRQQNPPPICLWQTLRRLRCFSPHLASLSPAWLFPQGMTYTASNRLPCLGFSQWEGPAEVQPMGVVGRRQGREWRGHCRPRASMIAQLVKNLSAMQETLVRFLGGDDPLEQR